MLFCFVIFLLFCKQHHILCLSCIFHVYCGYKRCCNVLCCSGVSRVTKHGHVTQGGNCTRELYTCGISKPSLQFSDGILDSTFDIRVSRCQDFSVLFIPSVCAVFGAVFIHGRVGFGYVVFFKSYPHFHRCNRYCSVQISHDTPLHTFSVSQFCLSRESAVVCWN